MAKLTETQLDLIKKYASHPNGIGYVADFSNQSFSSWFRDTWGVDIDDPKFESEGTSKGNRLVSFCRQGDDDSVFRVLNSLRQIQRDLGIDESHQVSMRVAKDFEKLIDLMELNASKNVDKASDEFVLKGVTRSQLISRAKSNEVSLLYICAAALESLSEFRDVVRADNYCAVQNSEDHRAILELTEALIEHIELLLGILPSVSSVSDDLNGDQLVGWTRRYMDGAIPKLQEYIAPERLGSISVPVGVILVCGSIGSLLTGLSPIGFGAGSLVGKLIIGEMKSGVAADKISDGLNLND